MKHISVIIPTYNRQFEVLRAVESVIKQTIKPFEIIVVDDGSTDNTESILSPVKEHIRYIKTENNGVSSARNRGILESRGDWIGFLDSDDTWHPQKLQRQLDVISKTNSLVCFCVCTDEKGHQLDDLNLIDPSLNQGEHQYYPPEDCRFFIHRTHLLVPSLLVEKKALMRVGLFDELLKVAEDTKLIYRLVLEHGFSVINQNLVGICRERNTPGLSDTQGAENAYIRYGCYLQVQAEAYWAVFKISKTAAKTIRKNMLYFISRQAEIACALDKKNLAKRYAQDGISINSSWKCLCRNLMIIFAYSMAKKFYSKKWTGQPVPSPMQVEPTATSDSASQNVIEPPKDKH